MNQHEPPVAAISRRHFIKCASAAAAALGTASAAHAQSSPNDRISIGMIGAGSRAGALMGDIVRFAKAQNAHITAVCDVWRKNRETAAATIKEKFGKTPRQFSRYNDLLSSKDIDAVVIATPDFSHGAILNAALEARKDVYIGKPMTIDLPSANRALDAARANKLIVQAGTQRRSEGRYVSAANEIASGVLGKISRVSIFMGDNGPRWARSYDDCVEGDVDWPAFLLDTPSRPFDAKLLRRWQLYRFSSNGIPGLWMTHFSDLVSMLTGAKYPSSAVAMGGIYVWKDGREHPDTFQALMEYPEGFLFDFGMGLGNKSGIHCSFHGTDGTLDAQNWTLTPEAKQFESRKIAPVTVQHHMENWLECLRTRKSPAADIQLGHQHVVATVMAATAFETGRRQKYDPANRTIISG